MAVEVRLGMEMAEIADEAVFKDEVPTRNASPLILNSKPKALNPKPEIKTQNPEPEPSSKPEIRNPVPENRSRRTSRRPPPPTLLWSETRNAHTHYHTPEFCYPNPGMLKLVFRHPKTARWCAPTLLFWEILRP